MYIPPETIESIRNRVVIQDIIKKYVPSLKKKGKNYTGLCPFHREKTPSFSVAPDKQIFYCFGCHAGGNIFSFISKIERLDFPESVKFVGDIVGIDVAEEKKGDTRVRDGIYRINKMAAAAYHAYIKSPAGQKGLSYITGRGVNAKSIDDFSIGFAPDSWDFLIKNFIKTRQDVEIAENIGLIRQSQNSGGRQYDVYRNRIIFPICDVGGSVIAFGGRTIGDDPRKYLNSTESEVFKKRNVLYGLDRAKDSIKDLDRAIVVEGYLDVVGCHQQGIQNVVAPLGTALTSEQIKALAHYCTEIIFLFDADSAGARAAFRSLDITEDTNVNVRVGMLPEGDPFDYIMSKGVREFMAVVDSAVRPADFRISRIMQTYGESGRVNTLMQLFGVIRDLKLETERSAYITKISSLLGVDEKSVRADFRNYLNRQPVQHVKNTQTVKNDQNDAITRSFRDLVKLLCHHPELIEKAAIDYSVEAIPDELSRNILKKMLEMNNESQEFTADKIFDFFSGGPEMDFLNQIFSGEYSVQNPSSVYTEIFINMKVREIDDKIDTYAALIKSSPDGNFHEFITEIEVLRREKEKLSHYVYNKVM